MLEALRQLLGPDSVLDATDVLSVHSYDTWPVATKWRNQKKQPYKPDAVVMAANTAQVAQILRWASQNRVPVTPWGAGSSVTGAPLPVRGGVVLDLSTMNGIHEIDEFNLLTRVQAGVMGIDLELALNERGYTLNHSPQSLHRSTVGGWLATRASGQFSSRWGSIEDLVLGFTVVLPEGDVVEFSSTPRAAVGPDLRHLFLGAEGTTGIITELTLKIFPVAETRLYQSIAFAGVDEGVNAMREIMRVGLRPFLVRFYDQAESRHAMQDKNFSQCAMFLGVEGVQRVAEAEYEAVMEICARYSGAFTGAEPVEAWMKRRYDFSTIENLLLSSGGVAETIETAHLWGNIVETYHALTEALAPYATEVLGHFSHVYPQGSSLYVILLGQAQDDAEAEARLLKIWDVAMQTCLAQGAVISHHHGVGLARHPYLNAELGTAHKLLNTVRHSIDRSGIMNPGKLGFD